MSSSLRKWFLAGCALVVALSAPRAAECVGNGLGGPYRTQAKPVVHAAAVARVQPVQATPLVVRQERLTR
jgi:hypothetical protein